MLIDLTEEELLQLYKALQRQPFEDVAALLSKIHKQTEMEKARNELGIASVAAGYPPQVVMPKDVTKEEVYSGPRPQTEAERRERLKKVMESAAKAKKKKASPLPTEEAKPKRDYTKKAKEE